MAKLVLLQFDTDPECAARRDALSTVGATIVGGEPRWPVFFDTVLRERPDAIVIAGSTLSEHAREAARYLGEGFNTRNIPVVLVDVPPKELELTREAAPRATIVKRDEIAQAVKMVLSG